jgi:beta-lactamase class D
MNREDRELLAELGRLNSDVVPFAMKIMDESVTITAQEQYTFAERLMAMGLRLE